MRRIYLDKTKRLQRLSKEEQGDLIFDLIYALTKSRNLDEAALFLQDLLTKKEAENLSKRLRIAKLLMEGATYQEISQRIYVSHGTVAKIAAWLAEKGDGFRSIIDKLPKKDAKKDVVDLNSFDWDKLKRKRSEYFWPELLLEGIIKSANGRNKEKIKNVLKNLDEKSELYKRMKKYL
jgi:TrpR-related protein YerC/YecD